MSTPVQELEIGEEYECVHSRKGRFFMRITSVNGCWIEGVITQGKAGAMCSYNAAYVGDTITVRDVHSLFIKASKE